MSETIGQQQSSWRQFRRSQSSDYDDQAPMQHSFQRQYSKRNAGRDDFYGHYNGANEGSSSNGNGGGDGQNGNGGPPSQNEFGMKFIAYHLVNVS